MMGYFDTLATGYNFRKVNGEKGGKKVIYDNDNVLFSDVVVRG